MQPSSAATGQIWAAHAYAANARFVADLAGGVVEWLNPTAGEHILDVGCGDGALTERLAATGAHVIGIDTSPALLAAARDRGLTVRQADVRDLPIDGPFNGGFDAVFSNAVLHWVREPDRAAQSMARVLKPAGRLAVEFGGHGNIAAIATALRAVARSRGVDAATASPWFYPTTSEYGAILAAAGFAIQQSALIPRPTPLPTGMIGWLETFRGTFLDQFGADRDTVKAEILDLLKPALCDSQGQWHADYVRIRVLARKMPDRVTG
jgi:SAM-dependent methyltransferase